MAKASATKPSKATATPAPLAPRVAVLGGGIAGLSTAIQLLNAGFSVTLFEAQATLGGNLSSERIDGVDHDVYPHMFCEWYLNFWHLFEKELGLKRKDAFEPKPGVKMRRAGEETYHTLMNPTSIEACLSNLKSGVMSPAQMVLLGFSGLDLLSFPFDRSGLRQLQQLDVNGYLYSRGYATEAVAKMDNYVLSLIWSIPSEQTAAATYQNFMRHTWQFPDHAPFAWMLKGSLASRLIDPIEQHLRARGCDVRLNTPVKMLRIVNGKPLVVTGDPAIEAEQFDFAVCALNAGPLTKIAIEAPMGAPGLSLVECEPSLATLQQLKTTSIPVVDLYLTGKLKDFPDEVIGIAGSQYGLSALDISQLWDNVDFGGKTALIIAASVGTAIPSSNPDEMGWLMIKELSQFYPGQILPGAHWGDPAANIDWTRTHFRSNAQHSLFLNDVGSWAWRPATTYPATLERIAFAGDLCLNEVDMATVEGAVISGISAARAIQDADALFNSGTVRGKVIQALPHTVYSNTSLRAAKLWFLPATYAALGVVAVQEWLKDRENPGALDHGGRYPMLDYLALVPLQYTIDWWKGAYWLGRSLTGTDGPDVAFGADSGGMELFSARKAKPFRPVWPYEHSQNPGQPVDHEIGLGAAMLMMLGECADYAISQLGKSTATSGQASGDGVAGGIASLAQSFLGGLTGTGGQNHKRRWRAKP